MFDEEYTERVIELSQYAEIEPFELLKNAIDVMSVAYKKGEPDARRGETIR